MGFLQRGNDLIIPFTPLTLEWLGWGAMASLANVVNLEVLLFPTSLTAVCAAWICSPTTAGLADSLFKSLSFCFLPVYLQYFKAFKKFNIFMNVIALQIAKRKIINPSYWKIVRMPNPLFSRI